MIQLREKLFMEVIISFDFIENKKNEKIPVPQTALLSKIERLHKHSQMATRSMRAMLLAVMTSL